MAVAAGLPGGRHQARWRRIQALREHDQAAGGPGRLDDPLTRTVGASTDREPVRDASRICAALLRAYGASTQQPPRGSPHLAHARRRRARERCRPSFRRCTGWLGQDDCESSYRKIAQRASGRRTRRQVGRWSVGHHPAPQDRAVTSPAHRTSHSVGRGAYAICALPDLCFGIVSERLGHLDPWISFHGHSTP